ncbi:hypothetical protein ACIP1U_24060 [Cupriavidus sp. NPDC089707]|uniref:KUP/HAK/KT family potassium transporter n=1 Tax=Cupriavidus sp. NPDC089707 TaxID=3363963 RepID=UPI003821CD5F
MPAIESAAFEPVGQDCYRIVLRFGFMDRPDVPKALAGLALYGGFNLMETSFFLSRETIIPVADTRSGMALWREHLFATMSKNAGSPAEYFNIPPNRVIEIGTQVQI